MLCKETRITDCEKDVEWINMLDGKTQSSFLGVFYDNMKSDY